jgi:nucleoside-diphosphate-sugar epimerase
MRAGRSLTGQETLVTGGAGFIGSHLVDALLAAGARVRVLDDLSTGRRDNLAQVADRIEWIRGDIRDLDTCQAACDGVRVVFHQAALGSVPRSFEDPATTIAVNVTGSANIFAAARGAGVERVVYASSSSVYGDSEKLPKREGEEGRPLSPYAWSKRMTEELATAFALASDLGVVGLRYFNVFGPRQRPEGPYAAVIPRFFAAALAGEPARIFGDGEQSRDFTAVSDAVTANILAATSDRASGKAFNVATGSQTTVNDLAARIFEVVGLPPVAEHLPPRTGDVRHSRADLTAAAADLAYRPATSLARGLRDCLAFYRGLFS